MKRIYRLLPAIVIMIAMAGSSAPARAQAFQHPGIDQSSADLQYMRNKVLQGEEPWKGAFERLKASSNLHFTPKAFAHVLRGPSGRPNIGGNELSRSASMAYNCALLWYITKDKKYATKTIEILNAWPPTLWHFDLNDAKLLAGWTGYQLCNAAELIRYTNAGWKQQDLERFINMLQTVYYPVMRFYAPNTNGNWDGAILHSIIAISVFTDNRKMFNNAIDHYLHGSVNGSLFKYVYPSGQCQESRRDQGHVQLGLGEFAGTAQIAFTQGVDLFPIASNRLALGYEYTAGFLLGHVPQAYGTLSERVKVFRDDYEYVVRHYSERGIHMPYSKQALDSVRPRASRSILTATRVPIKQTRQASITPEASPIGYVAGAGISATATPPGNSIVVMPGQSIQDAINTAAGTGGWVVLRTGLHKFPATLKIPSNTTISGEGLGTVLFLDSASGMREAMVNATDDLQHFTIRDLVIENSNKLDHGLDPNNSRSYRGGYNRGGIIFRAQREGQMKNLNFLHLTIRNSSYNGIFISGAENINVSRCDFNENGGNAVQGFKLQHNLLLTHCRNVIVKDSRLDGSPFGCGISLDQCAKVSVEQCEIARNAYHGILIMESKEITVKGNLIEGNDRNGVMVEFQSRGSNRIIINKNIIHYNARYGVEMYAASNSRSDQNILKGNGNETSQQMISIEKKIIME